MTQLKRQCPIDLSCNQSSIKEEELDSVILLRSASTTISIWQRRFVVTELLDRVESRDARGTKLLVLPFGELHVRLFQQSPKVRAVSLEPPQAFERPRRVGELAVLFIRLQREIA
jgi:hypothetical protein